MRQLSKCNFFVVLTAYGLKSSQVNTYQGVVASDGEETFLLFLYRELQYNSNVRQISPVSGLLFDLLNDTEGVSLVDLTNVEVPGVFIFSANGDYPIQPTGNSNL